MTPRCLCGLRTIHHYGARNNKLGCVEARRLHPRALRQRRLLRTLLRESLKVAVVGAMAAALLLLLAWPAPAQSLLKKVALDPTTYVAAVVNFHSAKMDWDTSQTFFAHGWNERNAGYTVEGTNDGTPISYAKGLSYVRIDALRVIGVAALHNTASQAAFRHHARWGFAERVAVNGFLSYYVSHKHYRQTALNKALAAELWGTR